LPSSPNCAQRSRTDVGSGVNERDGGGEEFVVIIYDISPEAVREIA
jgi:hypothetical protein